MKNNIQELNKGRKTSNILDSPIVTNVISTLISTAILGICAFGYAKITSIAEIPSRLDALDRRVAAIELKLGIEAEDSRNTNTPEMDSPILPEDASKAILISHVTPSAQMESNIDDIINVVNLSVSSTQYAAPPRTQVTDPIGYVGEMQEECNIEQMADQKLLLNYIDEEQQVFFYGQFDEDGYWTGNCVINTYKDGKLTLIIDADYNHGALLTFEQAFPNETKRQGRPDVWYFSKRTMKEDFSVGETWDYIRDGDVEQTFASDSVTADDILTTEDLRNKIGESALEGYYNGNTSDGWFNDDSGTAYMVKYFDDGSVRTLYVGRFKDGFPEDSTGDSWLIGRNDTTSSYSYYKGQVKKGGEPTISFESKSGDSHWKKDPDWIVGLAKKFKNDRAVPVPLTGLIPDNEEKDYNTT